MRPKILMPKVTLTEFMKKLRTITLLASGIAFVALSPFVKIAYTETYRIEPGDRLSIIVMDYPQYSRSIQLGADGRIIYFGAEIDLSRKTLVEAAKLIQNQINHYGRIQDPLVIVDPIERSRYPFYDRGKRYLVWGAVYQPGYYSLQLQNEVGLYEALTIAGGTIEGANLTGVQIIRTDKSIERYNLSANQEYRKILVSDGDMVFVPLLGYVEVRGQVNEPGKFPFRERIRIDHALAMANGPKLLDGKADLASVSIVRANGKLFELNISDRSWKNRLGLDGDDRYYLEDGDLVYVPPLAASEIQGQIKVAEKKVQFHKRMRIDHALMQAGGPNDDRADLRSVVLVKKSGETIELDIDGRFWKKVREDDERYYLEDGDVLYIPNALKVEPVYVLGYVRNPGPYRIRDPITPRETLSKAGGFEELADRGKLKIWRKDGTIEKVNLSWSEDEDATRSKTLLYPGDALEVGKRFQINWSLILSIVSVTTVAISLMERD